MSDQLTSNDETCDARRASGAGDVSLVIGASGQDGYLLTSRLLEEGFEVHAAARRTAELDALAARAGGRLNVHTVDLLEPASLFDLVARLRPREVYNLAGESSVSRSFADPLQTWRTNAAFVARLLESLRTTSPHTRLYQASSTDMFGGEAGQTVCHNEDSPLNPRSPYASAKAAAHLLCRSYRGSYGLRVACGILANHESRRRPRPFLTRKIADHVIQLRRTHDTTQPLAVGNLKIERDWGFAPDYVRGMQLIIRQIDVRAARASTNARTNEGAQHEVVAQADVHAQADVDAQADVGANYRDYVLGTGESRAAWQLIDVAFRLAGFDLEWRLEGDDAAQWHARFHTTGEPAVIVDKELLRPADPLVIRVDSARAARDLGWSPRRGLEVFLADMIEGDAEQRARGNA
jgi:GDPmannose 4,6-dehydratase